MFPRCKGVNIQGRLDTDADFVHLVGIEKLYMMGCNQPTITDAAFIMRGCRPHQVAAAQALGLPVIN